MGLFDKLTGRAELKERISELENRVKATVASYPDFLLDAAGQQKYSIPRLSVPESQARLYQKLDWVSNAVTRVSNTAAGTPLMVKRVQGEETEDIIAHEFEKLLRKPNPRRGRFEFIQGSIAFFLLTGNAYWWLNKPSEDAPPTEIFLIESHRIEPQPDEQMYLKGYAYDPGNGRKIPLEPWEVVHFKRFNPFNPYIGMSPVEALAAVAVGDMNMAEWNTNFFADNNAKTPGALAFADPIPDAEWDKMKHDIKRQHGGTKRNLMMLRNVGEGGVNWVEMAMSQKDMQFLEGREHNKKEIYDAFAPGLYSWTFENATEANARAGRDAFQELAVWPILQSMQETITNDIMPLYAEDLRAEFADVRPKNRELEMKEIQEYARYHTLDEVRQKYYNSGELPDGEGDVIAGRGQPAGGFAIQSEEKGNGRPAVKSDQPDDADEKEDERRKFKVYAEKRLDEGSPEKLDEFEFHYLDRAEQRALKAEFVEEDPLVQKAVEMIDGLREGA